jgi:hypothetical protein
MGDPPSHETPSPISECQSVCGSGQSTHGAQVCRAVSQTARFHRIELDAGDAVAFRSASRRARLRSRCWMRGFQTIIAHRARRRQSKVHDRSPAFQLVMAVAMEQVRCSDRNTGPRRLDHCKSRVIVHQVVGNQDFLVPAPPQVQSRKIIKRPRRSDARKKPGIFLVPEPVNLWRFLRLNLASGRHNDRRWCWCVARRRLGADFIRPQARCENQQ